MFHSWQILWKKIFRHFFLRRSLRSRWNSRNCTGKKRNEREDTTLMIVTMWQDKYREALDDLDRLSRLVMDPMALDQACHVARGSSTSLYAPGFCSATTWSSHDKSITMERRNNNTPSDRARWNEIVDEISIERDRDPRNQNEEWEIRREIRKRLNDDRKETERVKVKRVWNGFIYIYIFFF